MAKSAATVLKVILEKSYITTEYSICGSVCTTSQSESNGQEDCCAQ